MDKVSKMANKSHKDRVQEYNEKLEKIPEHYDIPLVFLFFFSFVERLETNEVLFFTGYSKVGPG